MKNLKKILAILAAIAIVFVSACGDKVVENEADTSLNHVGTRVTLNYSGTTDTNSETYTNTNSEANTYTNSGTSTETNSSVVTDTNSDKDTEANMNTNTSTNTNINTGTSANTNTSTNTGTNANTNTDMNLNTYLYTALISAEDSENYSEYIITESDYFSDSDFKDVSTEDADAEIVLSGTTGTISDTTRGSSGSTVTITSKGIYHVTGSAEGVTIEINDDIKSGNVYLILDNVSMTNNGNACILVTACDKLIIQCVGENTLEMTGASTGDADGAIYVKDDVTINGSGALQIISSEHGIVCKDDLKITGAEITIHAGSVGLKVNDSVRISDANINIISGHDGIQVENDSKDCYFYMESGELTIDAGYDGIDVDASEGGNSGNVLVEGGSITISANDDGITANDTLTISYGEVYVMKSYEGLEAETVNLDGGIIVVYASDDGINAAGGSDTTSTGWNPWSSGSATGTLNINGGAIYINAGGDGLDSNGSIYVTGGLTIVEGPTNNGNGAIDKGDGANCVASITGGTVIAIGSSGMAVNFDSGTQCSALVSLSGNAGTTITVDDGSGFSFTTTKSFQSIVYSSPNLSQGESCTITTGSSSATMSFSAGLYYNELGGMGGMMGGQGSMMGGQGGMGGSGGQNGWRR